jgi:hypothetical protein
MQPGQTGRLKIRRTLNAQLSTLNFQIRNRARSVPLKVER